jgi:uncharacterized protein with ATP-grasp and redox domains
MSEFYYDDDDEDEIDDEEEVMRILDEFWDNFAEEWYEREREDEDYTIESYRKVFEITESEDADSS